MQLGHSFVTVLYQAVRIFSGNSEMNRHNPDHQDSPLGLRAISPGASSTLLKTSPLSSGRLLVLAPADSDYGPAIQRIWQLAAATGRRVHLLGLCKDRTQELSLRRQLIAMSALLSDGRVRTEMKIEPGTRWIDAIRRNYQTGDIIVCFAEQRDGILHKPLKQVLEEHVDAPIFILSELDQRRSARVTVFSLLLSWAGLLGIIAGAFFIQIRIMSLTRDWSQTALMLLSVFAELWLLWVWNHLLG